MAWMTTTTSTRRVSARRAAALALGGLLALAALAPSADAQGRYYEHRGRDRNWNGGYYRAPPLVYGSPYGPSYYGSPYYAPPTYYPPPVIYGPGLNFNLRIR